jgi:hypothetical protein
MTLKINECDQLRPPDRVCEADSRTHILVKRNRNTGTVSSRAIEDQYEAVACFKLNETVPIDVVIHFETAKNLYLYAWFVFRFYPVSEQQALASLEFALRERFPEFVKANFRKRGFGLKKLLNHAIVNGHVRNELFTTRERWAWKSAEMRHSVDKAREMISAGLKSTIWSESEITVTQEDLNCDWLGIFEEVIPVIRNRYAHGSGDLKHTVLHTFELVSEIINQLYPQPN